MNAHSELPKMMTIAQLAKAYADADAGITEYRIRRMIWDGKIPYIRSGRRYLINEANFINYLNTGDEREEVAR